MTSDGHKLPETWSKALNDAIAAFQTHLISGQSSSWQRVHLPSKKNSSDSSKTKARNPLRPDTRDVSVYRKTTKTGDVYRIILDVPAVEETADLEAWRATIVTPELRQEWDPAVESAQVLEMCDPSTRIIKTNFTLGWPASPRDAVLICRTLHDTSTIVDVSTSLPRSPEEPSYLRPSPPYVRSHVSLFAWCIQLVSQEGKAKRVRVTCLWQHDLKTVWNIGVPVSIPQQLSLMVIGLLEAVKTRQFKIPVLSSYGLGVSIERVGFDIGRAALTIDYVIVAEDQETTQGSSESHGLGDLYMVKEQRRLQRSIKLLLPSCDGWDIRVTTRASSETVAQLPWSTSASKYNSSKVSFQIQHAPLFDDHSALKVKLVAEFSAALKGVRVNGLQHAVEDSVDHELKSFTASSQLLKDATSAANVSLSAGSASTTSAESDASDSSSLQRPLLSRTDSGIDPVIRGPAFDKSVLARIRRNYIYFSSLLQEPEAKWKRNSDVRGVSVTQLDSIDPTLVVYKAEATFVGVGLWDLYSAIVTPGTRAYWDRQYEDASLLEDVNELTELWHFKTKPAWPVTGRDCVVLKTVYKSPTTIHVFAFSVDDPRLFPTIPPVEPGTIRTQVDLQGWAIEALSPTTTQLTLLEQSDPKGWTGKSTVPQQMIAAVAGVGEFAIKHGGPPVLSRITGARSISQKYDHDRGLFRVEYEPSASRKPATPDDIRPSHSRHNSIDSAQVRELGTGMITPERSVNSTSASIECELRCDIDTWATSFDIVIDPPPQSITCLRRHRFSAGGGGLWLTFGHDIPFNSEERLQAIVRRAPVTAAKEKGIVMVNGKRITVDVEDLPESEVKSLAKQKRIKPVRIPLDQPPVMGVIRRRRIAIEDGDSSDSDSTASVRRKRASGSQSPVGSTVPKIPSPLSTFFTTAMEQVSNTTQQAVAAFVPPAATSSTSFSEGKKPLHYVLDALGFAQSYHRGMYRDNWTNVAEGNLQVQKRLSPEISPIVPVYRGEKVIEGVTADEVASVVFSYDCRKQWDERFYSVAVLEEYGADCHTAFLVTKSGFPFRDRGLLVASLLAREDRLTASDATPSESDSVQSPPASSGAIYCVSASFNPSSLAHLSSQKYNPHSLPIGRIYIDAWIMETLDPYTTEKYAIPSMRCIRLTSFDAAGSVPVAFNTVINASLPRSILSLESYMKTVTPFPEMRLPSAGFRLARTWVDEEKPCWKLRRGCSSSILLNSKLGAKSKLFTANILVAFEDHKSCSADEGKDRDAMQTPLRPGRVIHLSRPASPDVLRRQRADSAGSLSPSRQHRREVSSSLETTSPISGSGSRERIRSSSSAFTIGRGRPTRGPVDLIVAEVVIDLRTYPDGYDIQVQSLLRSREDPSRFLPLSQVAESELPSELPIAHSVHLLPPSPLYTSGSGVDTPTRHLLRLTLPTAQYESPAVEDPLTGETRNPPSKPQWYTDLEEGEKRAIVRVTARPLPEDKRKKDKKVVYVDGALVLVNEKDVYKGVLSDELGAAVLSRTPVQEGEDQFALPNAISSPLAVQDSLLNPSFSSTTLQNSTIPSESQNDGAEGNVGSGDERDVSESPGQATPTEEKESPPPAEVRRGLFGFISSYKAPLSLHKSSSSASTEQSMASRLYSPLLSSSSTGQSHLPHSVSGISSSAAAVVRTVTAPRYSLSILVVWVLIAFLLGSLLRSLLSPADFIYVVTDLSDVPEGVTRGPGGELGPIEPGWREIKRLIELKYIVGGWDFQIAVVRRH